VSPGGGFVAVATSYSRVEFDNFTVTHASSNEAAVSSSAGAVAAAAAAAAASSAPSAPSRCGRQPPAAGQTPVMVGCGEPAADATARWDIRVHDPQTGAGAISLRSDPSLCLSRQPVADRVIKTELAWSSAKHDRFIQLSDSGRKAEWRPPVAPGKTGESQRLVVESPWSQLTSECQRFGPPPRLNH
jgi:hypothetical protein